MIGTRGDKAIYKSNREKIHLLVRQTSIKPMVSASERTATGGLQFGVLALAQLVVLGKRSMEELGPPS